MSKKGYKKPALLSLDPTGPIVIDYGNSQGSHGEILYTWDPDIPEEDQDMFWASFDDSDLQEIDTDGNLFISAEEFTAWYNTYHPW